MGSLVQAYRRKLYLKQYDNGGGIDWTGVNVPNSINNGTFQEQLPAGNDSVGMTAMNPRVGQIPNYKPEITGEPVNIGDQSEWATQAEDNASYNRASKYGQAAFQASGAAFLAVQESRQNPASNHRPDGYYQTNTAAKDAMKGASYGATIGSAFGPVGTVVGGVVGAVGGGVYGYARGSKMAKDAKQQETTQDRLFKRQRQLEMQAVQMQNPDFATGRSSQMYGKGGPFQSNVNLSDPIGLFTNGSQKPTYPDRLESGVIVDRHTNQGYVMQNGKIQKTGKFPVLTGENKNGDQSLMSTEARWAHPEYRVTPRGTYSLQPDDDIYEYKGYQMRPLNVKGSQPQASNLALHKTYNTWREQFYNTDKANKTMGCINCGKEDIDNLYKNFPKGDTLLVFDSRTDPDFLSRLNSDKPAVKASPQPTKAQTQIPARPTVKTVSSTVVPVAKKAPAVVPKKYSKSLSGLHPQDFKPENSEVTMKGSPISISIPLPETPQRGKPVYGPGNTIIGYSGEDMTFSPTRKYTGRGVANEPDRELLSDPKKLKQYVKSLNSGYKLAKGGLLTQNFLANQKAVGGSMQPMSKDTTVAVGPSHAQGGIELPNQGANVEGGETTSGNFIFSKQLGFAQIHKPIARAQGKIEDKPATAERMEALQRLDERTQQLKSLQEGYKQRLNIQ